MSSYPSLLRRSVANRHIAGVCGGIGEYLGFDPTVVRVAYVLLSVIPGAIVGGCLIYVILCSFRSETITDFGLRIEECGLAVCRQPWLADQIDTGN